MRMPFRPAQATSVTAGSAYTTKPYLPMSHHLRRYKKAWSHQRSADMTLNHPEP